jgi:pSer/pThr/pTyr-binding forkhead associated (FHA) protein
MNPRLVVVAGRHANREVTLPFGEFRIGRGETCHLRPNSEHVSREHCVLAVERGQVLLYDMGSFNGTWVNGTRIDGEVVLHDGDRIQIGPLLFEFWCDPPTQASASSWLCRRQAMQDKSPPLDDNAVAQWLADGSPPNSSRETREMPSVRAFDPESVSLGRRASTKTPEGQITRTQDDTSRAAAAILTRIRTTRQARV